jgi:hypothetical protein
MTATAKILPITNLRIVESNYEDFESYEEYVSFCNQVRKYIRTLPCDVEITFDSIPMQYRDTAVRIIVESDYTTIRENTFTLSVKNRI